MIRATEKIWIGDSHSLDNVVGNRIIGAVLNVAQDLPGACSWADGIDYAQVGLIDGPGNEPSDYYAAILTLDMLVRRIPKDRHVLACCHNGGRSLAVVLMFLNGLVNNAGWQVWCNIIQERVDMELPPVNMAHIEVFNDLDWKLIKRMTGRE